MAEEIAGKEIELPLPHITLRALSWGPDDGIPVLALHGWLDNAASFARIAPLFPQMRLIALDFAGQGKSDHRPDGVMYYFADMVFDVYCVMQALNWDRFTIMGHSMGGSVAALFSSCYADHISHLIMLESFGPLSQPEARVSEIMADSFKQRRHLMDASNPVYPDMEMMTRMRAEIGKLDEDIAHELVVRNATRVAEG